MKKVHQITSSSVESYPEEFSRPSSLPEVIWFDFEDDKFQISWDYTRVFFLIDCTLIDNIGRQFVDEILFWVWRWSYTLFLNLPGGRTLGKPNFRYVYIFVPENTFQLSEFLSFIAINSHILLPFFKQMGVHLLKYYHQWIKIVNNQKISPNSDRGPYFGLLSIDWKLNVK